MVELVKGISKLSDRRLEADRPRHSIQIINDHQSAAKISGELAANQNKLRFNRVASQQNFEKMKNEEKLKEDGFSCPSIFVFGSAHVASWLALPPSSVGVTVGALSPSGL
ncbi:hypothetical protein TNCV_859501 [Trichonephila clavipes]|nr:hypothetical protein TNCV_859501 [Trichonephila clavipes]